MKMKLLPIKSAIIFALFIFLIQLNEVNLHVNAFSNQVVQQGAIGDDVIELQSRLQYIGYYNGKIDGVFSWKTYWAVRNFQYEFGLPIDGLVGGVTKDKLVKASKYDKNFVKQQIQKGNKFTHYGGVDLNKQKTPVKNNSKPSIQGQAATPKPKAGTPTPPTKVPNSKAGTPTPPAKVPNSKSGSPTPLAKAPNSKAGAPNSSAKAPNSKAGAPKPPAKAPNSKTKAPKPPAKLPKKPTAVNTPGGFAQNDIKLMANAVYGESRGEPYTGQVAVAAVILNRVNSATFPNTVSGVIFEPGAFTAVADGQIWLTPNENAKKAVLDAINGMDPTGEAIYYFNPDTATNKWIWSRPQIKRIGKHIFCK